MQSTWLRGCLALELNVWLNREPIKLYKGPTEESVNPQKMIADARHQEAELTRAGAAMVTTLELANSQHNALLTCDDLKPRQDSSLWGTAPWLACT